MVFFWFLAVFPSIWNCKYFLAVYRFSVRVFVIYRLVSKMKSSICEAFHVDAFLSVKTVVTNNYRLLVWKLEREIK